MAFFVVAGKPPAVCTRMGRRGCLVLVQRLSLSHGGCKVQVVPITPPRLVAALPSGAMQDRASFVPDHMFLVVVDTPCRLHKEKRVTPSSGQG